MTEANLKSVSVDYTRYHFGEKMRRRSETGAKCSMKV